MPDYRDWPSLRELDEQLGLRKGSAFRAFRRLEPGLREGEDFVVLQALRDRDRLAALRAQQRIYASSVNVVLLSAATAHCLRAQLSGDAPPKR